jgi:TATA-box binding protein (TBP) (component of TFIID and TFIIIB)
MKEELNNEWLNFTTGKTIVCSKIAEKKAPVEINFSDIYISTKTKIAFLTEAVDLNKVFWKIPITPYHEPICGILKKSIKYNCHTLEDSAALDNILGTLPKNSYKSTILNKIDIKTKKMVKYKDTRKIDIGISHKDVASYKFTKKGAFYNCFAIILRVKYRNSFKEVHIKIFNTGKLEIPGIQKDDLLTIALNDLIIILNNICKTKNIDYNKNKIENVLINSNFTCGFFINRTKLYKILKFTYGIHTLYDPCSYPGIQSKFYYHKDKQIQDGKCSCEPKKCFAIDKKEKYKKKCTVVSFMIFRTGSILIVGHCDEDVLNIIYEFLKKILKKEFVNISESSSGAKKKSTIKKVRKKIILVPI